jgi:hypothetical protein
MSPSVLEDRPLIAADPTHAGRAYLVWSGGTFTFSGNETAGWLSTTTNFGRSWSRPRVIVKSAPRAPYSNLHTLLVDRRTGVLDDIYYVRRPHAPGPIPDFIAYTESRDEGRTWSGPHSISADYFQAPGDAYGTGIQGRFSLSAASDPMSGRQYVTWTDGRCHSLKAGGVMVVSRARGSAWSEPLCLSERLPTFLPTVAVDPSGWVGISFYRLLAIRAYNNFVVDFVICVSRDSGRHFDRCSEIAPPFNIARALFVHGLESGYFVGDYEGMVAFDQVVTAAFVGPGNRKRGKLQVVSVTSPLRQL